LGTINTLKRFNFFSYLSDEQVSSVFKYMDPLILNKGEVLFGEGENGDYVCFVLEGELEVIKENASKEDAIVIATLAEGHSIGEMVLLDNEVRSATVRATLPTKLAVLTQNAFDMIVDKQPDIGINVMKGLAKVLRDKLRDTSIRLANEMCF